MAEAQLDWMLGVVGSANARGVKLQGEDEYHNWSKHGTPAEDARPVPKRGDKVKLGLDKDGYIRDLTTPDGKPWGSSAGGNGGGGGGGRAWTEEDTRRVTLLSALHSAVLLMQVTGTPEPKEGQPQIKASSTAMAVAKIWAAEAIAWAKQVPENGHD